MKVHEYLKIKNRQHPNVSRSSRSLSRTAMTLGIVLYFLLCIGCNNTALAFTQKHSTPQWKNITPKSVSTNGSDFNNSNYGFQAIAVNRKSGAVYVGTCYQGLWKSINLGKTWSKVNTGTNAGMLDAGRLWALVVDPSDPNIMYTTAGYGGGGVLKTTDGGVSWLNMTPADSSIVKMIHSSDIYSIAIDPRNHLHIIASFHGGTDGSYKNKAVVIESLDGGSTWTIHSFSGATSYPQYVYFLNNSSTWLLGSTNSGFWRTADAGQTWSQVSKVNFTDGGSESYRSRRGVWYVAAAQGLLQSSNDGRSWRVVNPGGSNLMALVGDGRHLYTSSATTGGWPGLQFHYFTRAESNGGQWSPYNAQKFFDGPIDMVYDSVRRVVYSSNWRAGVWMLKV